MSGTQGSIHVNADPTPASGLEEQAHRRLRTVLVEGVFVAGERLSLRRVAAALGTSVMPVRSALRRLATEQALEVGPSGSASVPRLTRAAFLELGAIRAELEPLALRLAAPRPSSGDLDELEALARLHTAARQRGGAEALLRADRDFLFRLYRASAAPMLIGLVESLWLRRGPVFWEARWMLVSPPTACPGATSTSRRCMRCTSTACSSPPGRW